MRDSGGLVGTLTITSLATQQVVSDVTDGNQARAGQREELLSRLTQKFMPKKRGETEQDKPEGPRGQHQGAAVLPAAHRQREDAQWKHDENHPGMEFFILEPQRNQSGQQDNHKGEGQAVYYTQQREADRGFIRQWLQRAYVVSHVFRLLLGVRGGRRRLSELDRSLRRGELRGTL